MHFHCLSWYRKDFVSKHPVSARSRQRATDIQFYNNSYLRIICRNAVWKVFWQFNQVNQGIRALIRPTAILALCWATAPLTTCQGCPSSEPCVGIKHLIVKCKCLISDEKNISSQMKTWWCFICCLFQLLISMFSSVPIATISHFLRISDHLTPTTLFRVAFFRFLMYEVYIFHTCV